MREEQIRQEEGLTQEMARLRAQEMQDSKLRQQIRETSYEIRELEAKLRAGYMNKERAAQLAEKEARRQEEKVGRMLLDSSVFFFDEYIPISFMIRFLFSDLLFDVFSTMKNSLQRRFKTSGTELRNWRLNQKNSSKTKYHDLSTDYLCSYL